MEWGQRIQQDNQNALQSLYQPTGKRFERVERKTLTLDVTIGEGTTFSETLIEPFKIDKLCDVYLDSFVTFDSKTNLDAARMAFLLGINEFSIQSNSNESKSFNKIVIPNTSTATGNTYVHKGKKFNYICSINPTTLSSLNGTLTDLAGVKIGNSTNCRFIAELVFVPRD
jgi:hypothetical protein